MKQREIDGKSTPRLLMLTHRFPFPPNRGDRIRAYHLLRFLVNKYSVTLASVSDATIQSNHLRHVESLCESVHVGRLTRTSKMFGAARSLLESKSLTEGMLGCPGLAGRLANLQQANSFDAVVVFCSGMFPYVDNRSFRDVPMLVDLVDVDSMKWRQMSDESSWPRSMIYGRESGHVRRLEQRIAQRANAVILVSEEESKLYEDSLTAPSIATVQGVSNGVDTDYFSPNGACLERPADPAMVTKPGLSLVFTGVMNYHPNVAGVEWFCNQVLPKVRQRLRVSFKIVGRSPNATVRRLGKLSGVEVVGGVPDVRPYLVGADVAVSPLKLARGIQNKVLEAMAMQRPVVCTTPSAEGIAGDHQRHFLIADTVDQWVEALTKLNDDRDLRLRLSAAARQRVVKRYSWAAKLQPISNLLNFSKMEPAHV